MSLTLTEAAAIGRRLAQVTSAKANPIQETKQDSEQLSRIAADMLALKRQADRIERLLVALGVNPSTVAQLRGNHEGCTLQNLMEWVAYRMGITLKMIVSPSRQCQIAWARQIAMWLAVRHLKLTPEIVGTAFHRDRDTVHFARRKVDREIALGTMKGTEAKQIESEWMVVMKAKGEQ